MSLPPKSSLAMLVILSNKFVLFATVFVLDESTGVNQRFFRWYPFLTN